MKQNKNFKNASHIFVIKGILLQLFEKLFSYFKPIFMFYFPVNIIWTFIIFFFRFLIANWMN